MGNVMMLDLLHLVNSEDGTDVIVTELSYPIKRYMLKFRDTDANQNIATVFISDLDYALQYARNLIEGTKP
jgi:uncharacterized protein YihD (DUF1040 family)